MSIDSIKAPQSITPQELTPYTYSADSIEPITDVGTQVFRLSTSLFSVILVLSIFVIAIIASWKLFKKAGQKGWKSIIPIYNTVILFKIAGLSAWWALGYFASIIPVIGGFISLGVTIYLMYSLAKAFGKSGWFAVGLLLLSPIFLMILAFGNSEYQLNK